MADRAAPAHVSIAVLLDEMHTPVIATRLQRRGHDVIAVAARDDLRALTDAELFRWAGERQRRLVTENAKDFVPILRRAQEMDERLTPQLLTSSRTCPRSRRSLGLLIEALHAWLVAAGAESRPIEDWLPRA